MRAYTCATCTGNGTVKDGRTERTCPNCGGTGHIPCVMLTAVEVAETLGFPAGKTGTAGAQRVYRLVKAGALRGVRVGAVLRIPAAEVERLAGAA